jgi:hypothetical protein
MAIISRSDSPYRVKFHLNLNRTICHSKSGQTGGHTPYHNASTLAALLNHNMGKGCLSSDITPVVDLVRLQH